MNTISLFSGCGGMDFGASSSGANIVYANDICPDSCETLRRYFPNVEVTNKDIHEIRTFPKADLVIGGYPCQSFSMGGNRNPDQDNRTALYQEFARCVNIVNPKYFVAENVDGLQKLKKGRFFDEQVALLSSIGRHGYNVSYARLNAKDYGVPQSRKRVFIIGVRKDLGFVFRFPNPTHGINSKKNLHLKPYASHGKAIAHLPLWPEGEFYERPHDPDGHFSWYYMSRNRKAPWDGPGYTVVANWRHITLHPAGPKMELIWSDLGNGWKQKWDFCESFEHLDTDEVRPILEKPRRLSWRECAAIQTFPAGFEPIGKVESKFTQIGNAVPPKLAEVIITHLISGKGLFEASNASEEFVQKELF